MWHGDVGDAARRVMLAEPPDVLLTAPESLKVTLVTSRVEHQTLFSGVQPRYSGEDWQLNRRCDRTSTIAAIAGGLYWSVRAAVAESQALVAPAACP